MNLAEVRQDIGDLLAGANANVYFFPPEVPMLPAIIIVPANEYIKPVNIGSNRFMVRFRITFAVAATNNQASLNTIEELIFHAYDSLPIGYKLLETSQPQIVQLGQTELLSCDLLIETILQIEE